MGGAGGGGLCEPGIVFPDNPRHFFGGESSPPSTPPLEGEGCKGHPVRLGLRQVRGLKDTEIEALIAARAAGASTLEDLARRARLARRTLELLAEADAFRSLGMDRREGLWRVKAMTPEASTPQTRANQQGSLLAGLGLEEDPVQLPRMQLPAHVAEDY